MLQGQDPCRCMVTTQRTAFQVLRKQAGFESWAFVLFLVLICAGVNTETILTVELKGTLFLLNSYLDAALLPWNETMIMC